jgi:hypothetical protein
MEIASLRNVFLVCQTHESLRWPSRGCTMGEVGSGSGFGSGISSSTARAWKISSYFEQVPELYGEAEDWCLKDIRILFLPTLTSKQP